MKVDTNKIIAGSMFAGFSNYANATFSASIAGQNLAAGGFVAVSATTPLNNSNAISQIKIQYSGLDSFWRLLPGSLEVDYPSAGAANYQIESFSYYTGTTLHVDTYVSNQTGGIVAIPAITINCRAFLFIAPF